MRLAVNGPYNFYLLLLSKDFQVANIKSLPFEHIGKYLLWTNVSTAVIVDVSLYIVAFSSHGLTSDRRVLNLAALSSN